MPGSAVLAARCTHVMEGKAGPSRLSLTQFAPALSAQTLEFPRKSSLHEGFQVIGFCN